MKTKLKYWLRAVKILIWISILGFGLTLFNSIYLITKSNDMLAEVKLKKTETFSKFKGKLELNSGIYIFKSASLADRLIFKHTYGNWGFIESLFSFITCFLLLLTVNEINSDNPFTLKIAQRITVIGIIYIAYGLINIAASYYMYAKIAQMENQLSVRYISFPSDLSCIKSGIFILIFSFIYRIGVTYQQENQLTI